MGYSKCQISNLSTEIIHGHKPEICINIQIMSSKTAYKRMRWEEPCPTITQNFIFEASDQKVHPTQTRVLSFYEAMIVQSISDYSYSFNNSQGKQISKSLCAQVIGESVPPKLIEIICTNILKINSNLF